MAIHESIKPLDFRFVSRIIRRHSLDPKPMPGGWASWKDGKRTINTERYRWGQVAFVSDGDAGWASTLVMVGQVCWDEFRVRGNDGIEDSIPIPWIDDVGFPQQEARMTVTVPECLGYHDHCSTCDGGYNKASGHVESACTWRARCYSLKLYLMEHSLTAERFMDERTDPHALNVELADIERKYINKITPPAIVVPKATGKAKGTLVAKLMKREKRKRPTDPGRFSDLEPLVDAFLKRLQLSLFRLGYDWKAKRSGALPGDVFVNRVTDKSNYITVYIATSGHYAKVCVIKLKPLAKRLDIAFSTTWDKALALPGAKLKQLTDPAMPVAWRGVRTPDLARAAAKLIGRMMREGILEMPPPRNPPPPLEATP